LGVNGDCWLESLEAEMLGLGRTGRIVGSRNDRDKDAHCPSKDIDERMGDDELNNLR
jgi:hypothetical protein